MSIDLGHFHPHDVDPNLKVCSNEVVPETLDGTVMIHSNLSSANATNLCRTTSCLSSLHTFPCPWSCQSKYCHNEVLNKVALDIEVVYNENVTRIIAAYRKNDIQ